MDLFHLLQSSLIKLSVALFVLFTEAVGQQLPAIGLHATLQPKILDGLDATGLFQGLERTAQLGTTSQ